LLEADVGLHISPNQHGYRPGRSTNTALHDLTDWIVEIDGRERVGHILGNFLDISGAFDNVRWSQLVSDMHDLGCNRKLVTLATNYLLNRTATYEIGSIQKSIKITRGLSSALACGTSPWILSSSN